MSAERKRSEFKAAEDDARLLMELREIRLMIAENKATLRALVRSAERRQAIAPAPAPPPAEASASRWNDEAVRLLRGLVALAEDTGGKP